MGKREYIFEKQDYNNDNGMLTSVWGPSLWHVLHCISVNYPLKPTSEDKKHYKTFIMSLKYVLPCKYCRDNLTTNLKKVPLTATVLKTRESFSKWLYKLHDMVNTSLSKKSNMTFRDVQDRYEHFRARCSKTDKKVQNGGGDKNKKTNKKKELGCVDSIYGVKARCQLHIVPKTQKGNSVIIDKKCIGKHT
jgi:hypothetical protein